MPIWFLFWSKKVSKKISTAVEISIKLHSNLLLLYKSSFCLKHFFISFLNSFWSFMLYLIVLGDQWVEPWSILTSLSRFVVFSQHTCWIHSTFWWIKSWFRDPCTFSIQFGFIFSTFSMKISLSDSKKDGKSSFK